MKIYIDNCCYNRPYDNKAHMAQLSVLTEITAIMATVAHCELSGYGIVGSIAIENEIEKIRESGKIEKYENVRNFYDRIVNDYIPISADIIARAQILQTRYGHNSLDCYHLAFAEAAGATFLLTTDNRFVNIGAKIDTPIKVINPINFLSEGIK